MELGGNMPKDMEKRFALAPGTEQSIAIPSGDGKKDEKIEGETQQSPESAATSR